MDWSAPLVFLQLVFLETILSIDNAMVLAVMVSILPRNKPIPWPGFLARHSERFDRILGPQRKAALRVGLLGAYLGRAVMLLLVIWIIQNPWIKVLSGCYLIYFAFSRLGIFSTEESDVEIRFISNFPFWSVVLSIELTDLFFSLDNVIEASAHTQHFWIIMPAVVIGVLFMRVAAKWFGILIEREPSIRVGVYLLVMNIGVELLIEHFARLFIPDWIKFLVSVLTVLACVLYRHWKFLHFLHPFFHWLMEGATYLCMLVNWAFAPVRLIITLITWPFRKLMQVITKRNGSQKEEPETNEPKP